MIRGIQMSHNSLYILINDIQGELKDCKVQSAVLCFFPLHLFLSQSPSSKAAIKTDTDQPRINLVT